MVCIAVFLSAMLTYLRMTPSGAILNPAAVHACGPRDQGILEDIAIFNRSVVLVERERGFGVYLEPCQAREQPMNERPSASL
jgi:hypothetical protein